MCAKKQFGMTLDRFCSCSGWFPMILGLCLKDSRIPVLGTVIDRTLNLSCQTKAVHPLRKSVPVIPSITGVTASAKRALSLKNWSNQSTHHMDHGPWLHMNTPQILAGWIRQNYHCRRLASKGKGIVYFCAGPITLSLYMVLYLSEQICVNELEKKRKGKGMENDLKRENGK